MAVTSATHRVATPAQPRPPQRDRSQDYRAQQAQQQQHAQQNKRPQEPVTNTQGQTTGRVLNTSA